MSDKRERNPLDGQANSPSPSGQNPGDPETGEPQPVELLSAYLDSDPDLDPALRDDLESRLENDAELRQVHAELDVIRQGLRELRRVPAPRSYHVTPQLLGIPEPVALQEREPWYVRHGGGLRLATSLAAVLFVLVLSADLVVNTLRGPHEEDAASAPQAAGELRSSNDGDGSEVGASEMDEAGGGDDARITPASGGMEATATAAIAADSAEPATPDGGEEAADAEVELATAAIALDDPEPTDGDGTAQDGAATGESAIEEPQAQLFAVEREPETAASAADGGRDLRAWRIAEFGLVAVLAVLLTATVVLPRIGGRGRAGR